MSLALAVASLLLPVALGVLCGAVRLFPEPDRAVDDLNRFSLYAAFPALILAGQLGSGEALPSSTAFWTIVPAALLLALVPLRWVGRRLGGDAAATLGLVSTFPNCAYLGLPVIETVLGPHALGDASLLVGIHVVLSLTVGPVLLLAWSGHGAGAAVGDSARKIAKQPLFWSAVLGVVGRAVVPVELGREIATVLGPLGRTAGPTSLFLLGLYLHTHAHRLRGLDATAWAHVVVRDLWLPLVTAALVIPSLRAGLLTPVAAQVLLLQAAMPPGISTFAIARDLGVGDARVAQAIVLGTLASLATIPLFTTWALTF